MARPKLTEAQKLANKKAREAKKQAEKNAAANPNCETSPPLPQIPKTPTGVRKKTSQVAMKSPRNTRNNINQDAAILLAVASRAANDNATNVSPCHDHLPFTSTSKAEGQHELIEMKATGLGDLQIGSDEPDMDLDLIDPALTDPVTATDKETNTTARGDESIIGAIASAVEKATSAVEKAADLVIDANTTTPITRSVDDDDFNNQGDEESGKFALLILFGWSACL